MLQFETVELAQEFLKNSQLLFEGKTFSGLLMTSIKSEIGRSGGGVPTQKSLLKFPEIFSRVAEPDHFDTVVGQDQDTLFRSDPNTRWKFRFRI